MSVWPRTNSSQKTCLSSSALLPPSCVLRIPLLLAAVSSGLQSGAAWKKKTVFEQEVEMWKLLGGSLYLIPEWGAVLSIVK